MICCGRRGAPPKDPTSTPRCLRPGFVRQLREASCYLQKVEPTAWIAEGEQRRDRAIAASIAGVRALLPSVARLLVDDVGATQVIVFGSFAPGGNPGAHSDLDILVANLDGMAVLRAMGAVSRLTGRDVDLVAAERGRPEVVAAARNTGLVLHVS